MPLLLHIESTTAVCSAALSRNGELLGMEESQGAYAHAENLTVFCQRLVKAAGLKFSDLDAVAVSGGPGSYTGLRIGVSAAKGICYALGLPLISIDTLKAMASGVRQELPGALLCPMIDARRMEVYCAVYTPELDLLQEVKPLVIDETSFSSWLEKGNVLFSGDGAAKCRDLLQHPNAHFAQNTLPSAKNLVSLAEEKFARNDFADLALYEPFYLKTFQPGPKRSAE